jgi:hypothetical protein
MSGHDDEGTAVEGVVTSVGAHGDDVPMATETNSPEYVR